MRKKALPLSLTALIVLADQLSKAWIVENIPENTIGYSFFNGFLEIIHVRNDAIAFSLGSSLDVPVKIVFFIVLPIILMVLVIYAILSAKFNDEFTYFQRWCLAGIAGGGIGNLIDRVFRQLRVVDFISTDMYGFLGFDRFPTYNVADSAVVISVILLFLSMLFVKKGEGIKK